VVASRGRFLTIRKSTRHQASQLFSQILPKTWPQAFSKDLQKAQRMGFLLAISLITPASLNAAPEKPPAGKFKAWLIKQETSSNGKYEFLISSQT
jgi:hypothetical protein